MATYTAITDVDLPAVARAYGLEELALSPLHGGAANSSFRAQTDQGEFVLTMLDNHNPASATRLAEHTRTLFEAGVPTTQVVPTRDEGMVAQIGDASVILKRWVEGSVLQPLPDHHLHQAGRLLAGLHALPTDIADLPHRTRRLSAQQRALIPEFADTDFAAWLAARLERVLADEAEVRSPDVVSHGDLFADNLIVRPGGDLTVLDWETLCVDSALLDLGMAVVGTAQVDGRIPRHRAESVVAGYGERRPLAAPERAALPGAVEHAALIIAFHRYYRHNIRFPDPAKAELHREIVAMVEGLESSFAGW